MANLQVTGVLRTSPITVSQTIVEVSGTNIQSLTNKLIGSIYYNGIVLV